MGSAPTNSELQEIILERIRQEADIFINSDEKLQKVNFDLAVGGAEWPEGAPVGQALHEAEQAMVEVKAEQHKKGQYRPSQLPE